MQQRRVAQLLPLLSRERGALPAAGRISRARQDVAQAHRETRHAAGVAGGGRIARLDGDDGGADEPLHHLLDLLVQERVVDRGRRLSAQRGEQLLVFIVEGFSILPVERLEDADHLAGDRAHRHAEDAARAIAGLLVDVLIEARVLVRVGDVDADRAGDAASHREADLAHAHSLRDLAPQLAALLVDEEERAAVGLHHAGGGADDQEQQAVEIALGDEGLGDFEDAAQLFHPLAKLLHAASVYQPDGTA